MDPNIVEGIGNDKHQVLSLRKPGNTGTGMQKEKNIKAQKGHSMDWKEDR